MKKYLIIAFLVLAAAAAGYFYWRGPQASLYDFVLAQKGEIVQEVSVTGRVKPVEEVNLSFEKTGKVAGVYAAVGDKVFSGQLLAKLANDEIIAQIAAAEANIKAQEAKLAELQKGVRPEEIQVYEVKVSNAAVALGDAKQDLLNKLRDSYTKSDDAVRNKIDQFFTNPRSSDPKLNFVLTDPQLETDIEWQRFLRAIVKKKGILLVEFFFSFLFFF